MEKINPLFTLVQAYHTQYLPLEKKRGENTLRSYKKALEMFLDYIKMQKKVPLRKVSFQMIRACSHYKNSMKYDKLRQWK